MLRVGDVFFRELGGRFTVLAVLVTESKFMEIKVGCGWRTKNLGRC